MKSFFVLCFLVGAASSIPSRKTTLREYLEDLSNPDPLTRRQASDDAADVAADLDCANVCPPLPTLNLDATCDGNKWAPNYESKDGCECLTEYRCCSDSCDPVNEEQCWEDGKKGYYYGMKAKDCCDCPVIKCGPCIKPAPKEEVCGKKPKYPLKCYEYIPEASMDNVTACFKASCSYDPPAPPEDENCDTDCMTTETKSTECGADYKVCKKNRDKNECPNRSLNKAKKKLEQKTGLGSHCFKEPEQVIDPVGGKYAETSGTSEGPGCLEGNGVNYRGSIAVTETGKPCQAFTSQSPHSHNYTPEKYPNSGLVGNSCRNPSVNERPWCYTTTSTRWEYCDIPSCTVADMKCKPCKKWIFEKKNCTKMNEKARMEDCHMAGTDELDKKCFTKTITPDSCKCEHATCQREENVDEKNKFEPEDKCPKNHKKVTGVTICMKARDVCIQCNPVVEPTCDIGSFVSDDTDCNGCPIKRCEKFSIYAINEACDCGLYEEFDQTFYCTCTQDDKDILESVKLDG